MKQVLTFAVLAVALTGCPTVAPRPRQSPAAEQPAQQQEQAQQQPLNSPEPKQSPDSGKARPKASDVSNPTTK